MKLALLLVTGSLACTTASDPVLDPSLAVDVSTLSCAPQACKPAETSIEHFDSQSQVDIRLVGAWRFCGGADDHGSYGAGIELTPARELYVLAAAADGSCARTTEVPAADWYTLDISEQNPVGTYQLSLIWRDGGGSSALVPAFSTSSSALLDRFAGFEFRRLRP